MNTFLLVAVVIALVVFGLVRLRHSSKGKSAGGVPPALGAGFAKIRGNGKFEVEVVGESHYADSFDELERRHRPKSNEEEWFGDAILVLEDSNPHDRNAVAVKLEGLPVGYLSRSDAADFRGAIVRDGLKAHREFAVGARLYWGGVDGLRSVSVDLPQA
jgi:hypothetical protein